VRFQNPRRHMRGNILFAPVWFIGVLAGISVPAYQDYTVRAQATEGLVLAGPIKAAIAEAFASDGKWPRDLRALQFDTAPRGQYVNFAAVNRGTIVIRYSRAAARPLAGQQLTLRPTLAPTGEVVWSCGHGLDTGEDPASGAAPPHRTTIEPKYLPSACRG
jgi:type IV pilus assembly protein PilA